MSLSLSSVLYGEDSKSDIPRKSVKYCDTYVDDLEGLPDNGNRYEIIDGELFMTRALHIEHQNVVGAIYAELRAWSQ